MGLLNKLFRTDRSGPDSQTLSGTQFTESDDQDDEAVEREAARRELVQLCLRETMRRHAVPSDWIGCRIVPVVTSKRKTGMHVQLVVKQGQGNLLRYIPSFQSSLMAELEKFEPRAWDWLLSIAWQFDGISSTSGSELPGGGDWSMGSAAAAAAAAATAVSAASALSSPSVAPRAAPLAAPTAPLPATAAGLPSGKPDIPDDVDDDVMEDLQALFAIRDASLKVEPQELVPEQPEVHPDFEPTRPGFTNTGG